MCFAASSECFQASEALKMQNAQEHLIFSGAPKLTGRILSSTKHDSHYYVQGLPESDKYLCFTIYPVLELIFYS
jgi:hypothetical protein